MPYCAGIDRRRFLLTSLAGALAAPLVAAAQPPKVPRIAYLSLAPGPSARSEAFRQGLHEIGYDEGQNLLVEYRWADGNLDRARTAARATSTTPIVMALDYDPVGAGFVASLARPGGNITGLAAINPELSGKRLELLKRAVPNLSRVAVFWNPAEPNSEAFLKETQNAARALAARVQSLEVRAPKDLETAFAAAAKEHADAVTVLTDPVTQYHRIEVAALAAKHGLPTIYSERLFVESGGLMSYGASDRDLHRRSAVYVDKILRGAQPEALPVEQASRYDLVINMKTAKALGLTIPQSLLLQADQVIE
jgi:ABC-type uncharacterized transport system substrate-binding protein